MCGSYAHVAVDSAQIQCNGERETGFYIKNQEKEDRKVEQSSCCNSLKMNSKTTLSCYRVLIPLLRRGILTGDSWGLE